MKQTFSAKIDLQKLEGSQVLKGKQGQDLLVIDIKQAGLFMGQKGVYLDLVCFYDAETTDQYQNNGAIAKSRPKDSTDKTLYVGNLKNMARQQPTEQNGSNTANSSVQPFTDAVENDLPF